jgi:peptidoglycan hydrolase-like protein with peptidoglycan-binding domain
MSVLSFRACLAFVLFAALAASPAFGTRATRTHHASATGRSHSSRSSHKGGKAIKTKAVKGHKLHGQQAIESSRVTEIQQALIREHYLDGEASGKWDASTEAAMQKFQADQGWQTKLMPDSRALKKLGLGPDYSGAINSKDASFAPPPPASTIPAVQSAGFAAAAGVSP